MTVRMINPGTARRTNRAKKVADFQPLKKPPTSPDYFNDDQAAEFQHVCALMISRDDLTLGDLPTVENYAVAVTDYRRLTRQINAEGMTIINSNGNTVAHPAARMRRDSELQVSALSHVLALNPKARNMQAKEHGVIQDAAKKGDDPVGF